MASLKHPISALQEYAQQMKIPVPIFEDGRAIDEKTKKPRFWYSVKFNGKCFGPLWGESKNGAKTNAASAACVAFGIEYDDRKVASVNSTHEPLKDIVMRLNKYIKHNHLPNSEWKLLKEEGEPHNKTFTIQYSVGDRKYPMGSGKNKEHAKRRAAALALSELQGVRLREFIRGPISDIPFGQTVAEHAWETFGIVCEELNQNVNFCRKSELSAFLLEDKETGLLRTVSLGTGNVVSDDKWRKSNGEAVLDSHAMVIARRSFLVYLYYELEKLITKKNSIFEMTGSNSKTLVRLKKKYEIHLYMKNPPCGDGRLFCNLPYRGFQRIEVKDDHLRYHKTCASGIVELKGLNRDVVSCSDKLLLWNYVGLQGALLSNFILPLYISSVTISNRYSPEDLVRAICCRFNSNKRRVKAISDVAHPWIQYGAVDGIENDMEDDWRKGWSIYWSHVDMELTEEQLSLSENAGIIDGYSGFHLKGSERDGRIPFICKRNLFRAYRKICVLAGVEKQFVHTRSYGNHKGMSMTYKSRKNDFFRHLDLARLGIFPIMNHVDDFYLQRDDQRESVV